MNKRYRYPGVQPFTEEDHLIFNGREKDIENIRCKLYLQNLLVLQSKSGYGKSSLINAGVKPLFSKEDNEYNYVFISIKFNDLEKTPLQQLYICLDELLKEKKNKLALEYKQLQFSHNSSRELIQIEKRLIYENYLSNIKSMSLWQYFKRLHLLEGTFSHYTTHAYALSSEDDFKPDYNRRPVKYFLIFDQFEKLLFYSEEQKPLVEEFGKELADLYYQKIPSKFTSALHLEKYRDGDTYINKEFLDFFNTNPEWETFLRVPIPLCILIGIRTDKLILIDRLSKFIPDLALNKYELSPLTIEGVHKAIANPAKLMQNEKLLINEKESKLEFLSPPFTYQPEAKEKLINFLTHSTSDEGTVSQSRNIEVYQLQMICQHIEEKVLNGTTLHNKNNLNGQIEITKEDIDDLGDIVRNYYRNELSKFPEKENIIQKFIEEDLILEQEKRRVFIDEGVAKNKLIDHGANPKELKAFIEALNNIRIIRRERSSIDNVYHYELSHDTLISPAIEFKKERLLIEEKEKKKSESIIAQNLLKDERRKRNRKITVILLTSTILLLSGVIYIVVDLLQETKSANDRTMQATQKVMAAMKTINSHRDSINTLTVLLKDADKEISYIKQQYDSLVNVRKLQLNNIDLLKDKVKNLTNEVKSKESEIQEYTKNIKEQDKAIQKYNRVINNNNKDKLLIELSEKVEQLQTEKNKINGQLTQITSDRNNAVDNVRNEQDKKYNVLKNDYYKAQVKIMKLESDIKNLKGEIVKLKK